MIWATLGVIYVAAVFTLVFRTAPSVTLVTHGSEEQICEMAEYLRTCGIPTFSKNLSSQGHMIRHRTGFGRPSLHVVLPEDRESAVALIREMRLPERSDGGK